MPSRRQIREAAVQFLYCSDLEGGAEPSALREPFWEFLTESDRRNLQVASFRSVLHFAHGREERLSDFVQRSELANAHLTAIQTAEPLKQSLQRLLALESSWSLAFSKLVKLPKIGNDSDVADEFETALSSFFRTDRDLAFEREQFLKASPDYPFLRAHLEPVTASLRRLQRISDRLRMVEQPENFPDEADLSKLRQSKAEITELRVRTDEFVDAILDSKTAIDSRIASIVENYSPERIDPVDRAILRLGAYELIFTQTPPKAVLNEAIELAKRFGTSDSGRFVNGLLDKLVQVA